MNVDIRPRMGEEAPKGESESVPDANAGTYVCEAGRMRDDVPKYDAARIS